MDEHWSPNDIVTILHSAINLEGAWKYDLIDGNCEHFVNWCRYYRHVSMQVENYDRVRKAMEAAYYAIQGSSVTSSSSSTAASARVVINSPTARANILVVIKAARFIPSIRVQVQAAEAAFAGSALMRETFQQLPPETVKILQAYAKEMGLKVSGYCDSAI
jgi:hypothetical protein